MYLSYISSTTCSTVRYRVHHIIEMNIIAIAQDTRMYLLDLNSSINHSMPVKNISERRWAVMTTVLSISPVSQ